MAEENGPRYRTIRELADDERPRERLALHGPGNLSEAELIAIILGSGIRGENVIDLARRIVEEQGKLSGLARADVRSLEKVRGVGPAKATQIVAAIELGRRVQRVTPTDRELLTSPEAVFAYLGPRLVGESKERLFVLSLDTKGRLLGSHSEVDGGVSAVRARPAEVFRDPVILQATSVVLAHNHPSGDPKPSAQDVGVTEELIKAGKLLDIDVVDHVVIGLNSFVSLQREGLAFRANGRR
ncbi:MAG: DNA repair protein RadC [Dehalococcoidia bacterium]